MVLYTPGRTSGYLEDDVKEGIRIHFLGGAEEVGNVGCILEDKSGTRILIDNYPHDSYTTRRIRLWLESRAP